MPDFNWGRRGAPPREVQDRIVTVPNAVSLLRLLGLPVFAWLVLGPEAYAAAFGVLATVAATDWVDGYVARRFDQVTRLGQVLDPLIDRALLATAGITLLVAGIVPWWLVVVVVVRDIAIVLGAALLFRGVPAIAVTNTGKFATANLLAALPLFLLAHVEWAGAEVTNWAAWVFALVGVVAYYVAGLQYARLALTARQED